MTSTAECPRGSGSLLGRWVRLSFGCGQWRHLEARPQGGQCQCPTFGAMLRVRSQAIFFEVTTQKTDKSQVLGERGIPPFKERRVGHPAPRVRRAGEGTPANFSLFRVFPPR